MTERPRSGDEALLRRANILAVLVIVVAVLGVLLWSQRGSDAPSSGAPAAVEATSDGSRAAQLARTVSSLGAAWDDRDQHAFVDAAGTSAAAHAWADQTYGNLRELGVDTFRARFVAEDAAGIRPDGTFLADATVSWTPGKASGLATTPTDPATVRMVFRPSADGYDIEGVRRGEDPMPVWLVGRLRGVDHRRAHLLYIDGPDDAERPVRLRPRRLTDASKRARRAVRSVVRGGIGSTTVVIPADTSQSAALLGRADVGQIAAVTTTVDGSTKASAATYVVLNPGVYGGLGKRDAQVVLTHEVTHALTGAATSRMPLWVAEGFADYVALRDDRYGLRKSASQILAKVRAHGTPKALPDQQDFGSGRHGLGATYEAAWLAFELLHRRAPDIRIVDFYDAVRDGAKVRTALDTEFGLDVDSLTALWRHYLTTLAARGR